MLSNSTVEDRLRAIKPTDLEDAVPGWADRRQDLHNRILDTPTHPAATDSRRGHLTTQRYRRVKLTVAATILAGVAVAAPLTLPEQNPGGPNSAAASAIEILARTAAATALDAAGPGQLRYIVTKDHTTFDTGNSEISTVERWASSTGRLWFRTTTGRDPKPGHGRVDDLGVAAGDVNDPTPALVKAMPTQPAALDAWLRSRVRGSSSQDEAVFVAVSAILHSGYASPALRAAALRALNDLPDVDVSRHHHDALGRTGTALTFTGRTDASDVMLISPATGQLLEERSTYTYDTPIQAGTKRATSNTSTVLSSGVVNHLP